MQKALIAALLCLATSQSLLAQTVEERIVAGLQSQGYTVLEQGYTFLGRLRIVAQSDQIHRELVVNPGTGEILRDYAVYLSDIAASQPIPGEGDSNTTSDTVASAASKPARPMATVTATSNGALTRGSQASESTVTDSALLPMPPVKP